MLKFIEKKKTYSTDTPSDKAPGESSNLYLVKTRGKWLEFQKKIWTKDAHK